MAGFLGGLGVSRNGRDCEILNSADGGEALPLKPLLTPTEAAGLAGVTRSRFYRLIAQDEFLDAVTKVEGIPAQ